MPFKRTVWFWIAVGAVVFNAGFGIYASVVEEPMHAFVHGAIALSFGLLALHLRSAAVPSERQVERPDQVELLEADLSELERELRETQDRLKFADQLLQNKPPSS